LTSPKEFDNMFSTEATINPNNEPKSSLVVRPGIAFVATVALGFFFGG
jgi:hypothetical protein